MAEIFPTLPARCYPDWNSHSLSKDPIWSGAGVKHLDAMRSGRLAPAILATPDQW